MSEIKPLIAPTDDARSVFRKTLEHNPDADMRAIPQQWLYNERGLTLELNERIAEIEAELEQAVKEGKVGDELATPNEVIKKIETEWNDE